MRISTGFADCSGPAWRGTAGVTRKTFTRSNGSSTLPHSKTSWGLFPAITRLPEGQLLLATSEGSAAGCAALRAIDKTSCEMKRMLVYESCHGKGNGRALAERRLAEARGLGCQRMLLDTSIRQRAALGLHQRTGFQLIGPHCDAPKAIQDWLVFTELELKRWPRSNDPMGHARAGGGVGFGVAPAHLHLGAPSRTSAGGHR